MDLIKGSVRELESPLAAFQRIRKGVKDQKKATARVMTIVQIEFVSRLRLLTNVRSDTRVRPTPSDLLALRTEYVIVRSQCK